MGTERREPAPGTEGPFVVGIGASAGGLEALGQLLAHLPASPRAAFVVVQHLKPDHPSLLPELVARRTAMRVLEAPAGRRPEPDHVYVVAPGTVLTIEGGTFRVAPSTTRAPIDALLRSLAEDGGPRAVGVLLSGGGHDGTAGLRAIRERGGLTLAQDPSSAAHEEMPRSAIEAGVVDHVLAPAALAAALLDHVAHAAAPAAELEADLRGRLPEICAVVRRHTGHDFASYKQGTLLRRVARRLRLARAGSAGEYLARIERDAAEAEALVKDLLVGVTQFFRDPEVFQAIAREVVPRVVQARPTDAPVRVWVPGCASGEEAYSLAILVREHLERLRARRPVQIFATDLDDELLARARRGRYPSAIADHVSPERLARFFVRDRDGYEVTKDLRDACVFSQHSLVRDPPLSHLDLVSCRNVLIYLAAPLQERIVPLFHYALRPGGFLVLGLSEGIGGRGELFETVDKRHRIFRRSEAVTRPAVEFPLAPRAARPPVRPAAAPPRAGDPPAARDRLAASFERLVLEEYSHPCAVVDEHGQIALVAGPIARLLQLPAGAPTGNLLDAVRGSLRLELRAALQTAARTGRRVVRDGVPVDVDDAPRRVRLVVRPMPSADAGAPLLLVALQERSPPEGGAEGDGAALPEAAAPAVERLEEELRGTRAELRSTVEALAASNEELESSNEELVSTNEELQSANEELQTSKEELQSLNEELETVNAELRLKVEELATANADLQHLFASTELATVFLDRELRVARFTPAATALFRLREGDVGRPIDDLAPRFVGEDLGARAREVLRTGGRIERPVRAAEGDRWLVLRVLPYRAGDAVAGVVVTFVDVTEVKRAEEERARLAGQRQLALDAARMGWWHYDPATGLATYDARYVEIFGVSGSERPNDEILKLLHPQDLPRVWAAVKAALDPAAPRPYAAEYRILRPDGAERWIEAHGVATFEGEGPARRATSLVGTVADVTERKRAEQALRENEERLRRAQEIAHLGSWELDLERNRLHWSDEVYRIFGLAPQAFGASYEAFLDAVHPEDRAAVDGAYSGSLRDGRDSYEIVHRVVRRTTGEIRIVHEKCEHLRDARGRVVRSVGMVHDITERARAEEALERSREGLRRLAEASLSVISRSDLEGMLQAIAEAALALTGARMAACGHGLVGDRLVVGGSARVPGAPACPPGDMFQLERGGVHLALADGAEAIRLDDEALRAHPRWWGLPDAHVPLRGLLGVPMRSRGGRPSGMILVTDRAQGEFTEEDESLLRQLATVASLALQHVEARVSLEAADRHKNEFLAMLSHELRNPLAPIRNSLHVLDRAAPAGEQAARAHAVIDRQVAHMTRIVDELLDVTRISRGKIQLRREPLDLADLVGRAVEDHRLGFVTSRLRLEATLPGAPVPVEGDRTRVVQVIDNLLQNAAKFTPAGGTVTVGVEASEALGQAVVKVRDTGPGIPREVLPRLFEPFTQGETTLDRSKGGLGLGLALVKGLVEMHGGTVSAESGAGGAEFTVRLPLLPRGAAAPAPHADGGGARAPAADPPRRRARRVLVVEDNTDAAESLRELLGLFGHSVEVAHSGGDGIEKARAFAPDVVLCDIGLPEIDGYGVARSLRADPALRGVTLVALTGYAAPDDVARAREAGFDLHLPKPPTMEQLAAAVHAAPRAD